VRQAADSFGYKSYAEVVKMKENESCTGRRKHERSIVEAAGETVGDDTDLDFVPGGAFGDNRRIRDSTRPVAAAAAAEAVVREDTVEEIMEYASRKGFVCANALVKVGFIVNPCDDGHVLIVPLSRKVTENARMCVHRTLLLCEPQYRKILGPVYIRYIGGRTFSDLYDESIRRVTTSLDSLDDYEVYLPSVSGESDILPLVTGMNVYQHLDTLGIAEFTAENALYQTLCQLCPKMVDSGGSQCSHNGKCALGWKDADYFVESSKKISVCMQKHSRPTSDILIAPLLVTIISPLCDHLFFEITQKFHTIHLLCEGDQHRATLNSLIANSSAHYAYAVNVDSARDGSGVVTLCCVDSASVLVAAEPEDDDD
jgi:hypothetical protein